MQVMRSSISRPTSSHSPLVEVEDVTNSRGTSPKPSLSSRGPEYQSSRASSRTNLQVPSILAGGGTSPIKTPSGVGVADTLFEEESDLIRSCGALSSALGLRRSFSTSDISTTDLGSECGDELILTTGINIRQSSSDVALSGGAAQAQDGSTSSNGCLLPSSSMRPEMLLTMAPTLGRLEYTSRSCSTWVAVGDMASTSQLPSPQGGNPSGNTTNAEVASTTTPTFTPADFVRSVNKKVRQSYIKRRLITTYKALERTPQTEISLNLTTTVGSKDGSNKRSVTKVSKTQICKEILKLLRKDLDPSTYTPIGTTGLAVPNSASFLGGMSSPSGGTPSGPPVVSVAAKSLCLTVRDVEREQGKPLTKYERNMMIFNWLHSLDDSTLDRLPVS